MAKFTIDANINLIMDTEKMMDVPDEKIEQAIGQIIVRFSRWECDKLTIITEGDNNLLCQFWMGNRIKMMMGAIWRKENKEFTFHT